MLLDSTTPYYIYDYDGENWSEVLQPAVKFLDFSGANSVDSSNFIQTVDEATARKHCDSVYAFMQCNVNVVAMKPCTHSCSAMLM